MVIDGAQLANIAIAVVIALAVFLNWSSEKRKRS